MGLRGSSVSCGVPFSTTVKSFVEGNKQKKSSGPKDTENKGPKPSDVFLGQLVKEPRKPAPPQTQQTETRGQNEIAERAAERQSEN
mmetsp:Transcript_22254/g.31453  ORF Transcript_22254/g.31453 Transcript_22254/m.31453 type:complete len:86 (-) Transcript_22254:23-280(-)